VSVCAPHIYKSLELTQMIMYASIRLIRYFVCVLVIQSSRTFVSMLS